MRDLPSDALAALSSPRVPSCLLIRMDLSSTVYLSTAGVNIEHAGQIWLGAGTIGTVEQVQDGTGERQPLRFGLSSVPEEVIALALTENVRGKRCRVYLAVMDPDTYSILCADLVWSGTLDQLTLSESGNAGEVSVTAEHRGVTFARVKPMRYTDGDQTRLFPGDRALQFVTAQSVHQDIWPDASWGRQ